MIESCIFWYCLQVVEDGLIMLLAFGTISISNNPWNVECFSHGIRCYLILVISLGGWQGKSLELTIGLSEIPSLHILGRPYSCGGLLDGARVFWKLFIFNQTLWCKTTAGIFKNHYQLVKSMILLSNCALKSRNTYLILIFSVPKCINAHVNNSFFIESSSSQQK